MNTLFLLFAQFDKAVLTLAEVSELTGLAARSIQNLSSAGQFPKRLPGGGFAIQDIASWIDDNRKRAA